MIARWDFTHDMLCPASMQPGSHLVTQADQALRQLVDVLFDAAAVRVEEVAGHQDAVLTLPSQRLRVRLCRCATFGHRGGRKQTAAAASSLRLLLRSHRR
jgi:hypothetical protein